MGILISAKNLSKGYSHRQLFKDLSFGINEGERIGVIGHNGAGKSTLLKILSSRELPDSGELSIKKGLRVSLVEQMPIFRDNQSIQEALSERLIEYGSDPHDWQLLAKIQEMTAVLELENYGLSLDSRVHNLSGGWKKRIAILREFIAEPELTLLDEPTNHLDVEGIIWLENLINDSKAACMVITHDRAFLQNITTVLFEIDKRNPGGLLRVEGDYATFCERKEVLLASQKKEELSLKNLLRRETEWLRRGAKARTTKQQARIERAENLEIEVNQLEQRNLQKKLDLSFEQNQRAPKKLIEAKSIGKGFASNILFKDLDLLIDHKTRLGLIGTNGCGKSTLIKILLAKLKPDSGTIWVSDQIKVAYFDQARASLNPQSRVSEALDPANDQVIFRGKAIHVRSYLDRFLFSPEQVNMKVSELSGGEQARLMLARLMLKEANVLVLDEPTNDLDFATMNVLEEQLSAFDGAVILVCHDRFFLDQVCEKILAFPHKSSSDQTLKVFYGLSQWQHWFETVQEKDTAIKRLEKQQKLTESTKSKSSNSKAKLSYLEQRELDLVGSKIEKCEQQLKFLENDLTDSSADKEKLLKITQKMGELQLEIEALYQRWSELELKQGSTS